MCLQDFLINFDSIKLSHLRAPFIPDHGVQPHATRLEHLACSPLPRPGPLSHKSIQSHLSDKITNASKPGFKETTESARGIAIGHPSQKITNETRFLLHRFCLGNLGGISIR